MNKETSYSFTREEIIKLIQEKYGFKTLNSSRLSSTGLKIWVEE